MVGNVLRINIDLKLSFRVFFGVDFEVVILEVKRIFEEDFFYGVKVIFIFDVVSDGFRVLLFFFGVEKVLLDVVIVISGLPLMIIWLGGIILFLVMIQGKYLDVQFLCIGMVQR